MYDCVCCTLRSEQLCCGCVFGTVNASCSAIAKNIEWAFTRICMQDQVLNAC